MAHGHGHPRNCTCGLLRLGRTMRVREWLSFLVAAVAVTVAILALLHGYHYHPLPAGGR